jgi:hypothetical protein
MLVPLKCCHNWATNRRLRKLDAIKARRMVTVLSGFYWIYASSWLAAVSIAHRSVLMSQFPAMIADRRFRYSLPTLTRPHTGPIWLNQRPVGAA